MSTSLNVVSNAKVFWESFNRVATRFLSLVIGTCKSKSKTNKHGFLSQAYKLLILVCTLLSRSLGGSWGSLGDAPETGGGGGGALDFSFGGEVSTFGEGGGSATGFGFSSFFSGLVSSGFFSESSTWVAAPLDLEITAILKPGSTVSPSFATICQKRDEAQYSNNGSKIFLSIWYILYLFNSSSSRTRNIDCNLCNKQQVLVKLTKLQEQ